MASTQQPTQSKSLNHQDDEFVIENGILKGVEKYYAFDYESIGELTLELLNRRPEHIARIDAMTGRKITCKELKERSIRLAIWMTKEGIETGDIISISSPMHLDIGIIILASLFVGATYAPFPQRVNLESARRYVNYIKPRILFTCKNNASVWQEAAQLENNDCEMISLDADLGGPTLDKILEIQTDEEVSKFQIKPKINPSNICTIMPTSGTTGTPKFVCHTHQATKNWISAFCNLDRAEVGNEVTITYLYPEWAVQYIYWLKYLLDGCIEVFHAEFDPSETCRIIEKYKVNTLLASTHSTSLLCQDDGLNHYDLQSVSLVFAIGSKLYSTIEQKLRKRLRSAVIDKGLGTSETRDLTATPNKCLDPESVGIVLPNVQLKIIDVKSGSTLGPGQIGEICAKTPYSMVGYYKDPVNTKLALDENGWYHLGDNGYYDENGEIFVVGRLKEDIRFRNVDIHASFVEKILLSHPNVVDAAVVGIQHEVDIEHPVAFVKVAQDSSVTEEEILKLTRELEYCDAFEDSIFFIDEIPRSPNGKIKRNILQDWAEKMYAQRQKHL